METFPQIAVNNISMQTSEIHDTQWMNVISTLFNQQYFRYLHSDDPPGRINHFLIDLLTVSYELPRLHRSVQVYQLSHTCGNKLQ